MSKLLLPNNFSKAIFNYSVKFTKSLRKQQQGNFREIIRGLILSGSSFLTNIAAANSNNVLARKDVERLSNTLSKIDPIQMAGAHIAGKVGHFKNEPMLIFSDGGDIQKPYAKKMKKVCKNIDGSNSHRCGRGYYTHAMVGYGLETQQLSILSNHLFSTQAKDYKSQFTEESKMFENLRVLINTSPHDRIIVEDRGCDDEKRFKYFVKKLTCSFVTRINVGKNSRNIIIKDIDGNDEMMTVSELGKRIKTGAGQKKKWRNKKLKKTITSKIIYRKVFLPSMKEVPLYAIFCFTDEYSQPLVVLTDLTVKSLDDAWKYFFYYKKRWEVENFFRGIKQNFGAEKFTIQEYEKIQALNFMIMLAYDFLIQIYYEVQQIFGVFFNLFRRFCHRLQKGVKHHLSFLAFLRANFVFIPCTGNYRFCSQKFMQRRYQQTKNQYSLFHNSQNW